jgi:hypothetical protein
MKIPKIILLGFLLTSFTIIQTGLCQNKHPLKIQSIPQHYIQPEIDFREVNSLGIFSGSSWAVISTLDQNFTYTNPEGRNEKTKVSFLDLLYVQDEKGEFLHVYSDPAPDIENALLSNAAVDKGWIRKTTVLMWKHCLLSNDTKQNIQIMICDYNDILDMETPGNGTNGGIAVYSDPDLKKRTLRKTRAKELYYAYKIEPNAILIGNANRILAGTPPDQTIIGWISSNYCYRLDTKIWIARNNKPEAVDEMVKKKIFPYLFIDEQQARIFSSTGKFNNIYFTPHWDPVKNENQWFPFPLVQEREGIFKLRVVDNDFKLAYAPLKGSGMENPLFRKVILISAMDLSNVISNMSGTADFSGEENNRERLRKFLAGAYREEYPDLQEEMINNLPLRMIFESLFWIVNSTDPILNLKLRKINDPELISIAALDNILRSLRSSADDLKNVADYKNEDREVTFVSNDIRYFWVNLNLFY